MTRDIRRRISGAGPALVGTLALMACSEAAERLLDEVVSPDGRMTAVLMRCPDPANRAVSHLHGAVYAMQDKADFDCARIAIDPVASFAVSNTPEPDEPPSRVFWQDGHAVFEIGGERNLIHRQARSNASLELIRIKGGFEGADIEDEP